MKAVFVAALVRLPRLSEQNAVAEALGTAMHVGLVESLDDFAAVRLDHPLGRDVVDLSRELDVRESLSSCQRQ